MSGWQKRGREEEEEKERERRRKEGKKPHISELELSMAQDHCETLACTTKKWWVRAQADLQARVQETLASLPPPLPQ